MTSQLRRYSSVAEALKRAEEQKLLYERNLVGKSFLYVFIDKHNTITYREVKFERKNFLHLTGLDYKNTQSLKRSGVTGVSTDAEEFYNRLGRELVTISAGSTQKDKPQTQPYIPVSQLRKNALAQKKREQQKPHQIKKKKDQQSLD